MCVCGSRAKKSKFNVQQKKKLEIESGFSDRGRSCHYAINLTPSSLKKKNKKYLGKRFTWLCSTDWKKKYRENEPPWLVGLWRTEWTADRPTYWLGLIGGAVYFPSLLYTTKGWREITWSTQLKRIHKLLVLSCLVLVRKVVYHIFKQQEWGVVGVDDCYWARGHRGKRVSFVSHFQLILQPVVTLLPVSWVWVYSIPFHSTLM